MKVLGWLTHSVKKIITRDFVLGDNFFPRVLIYPNTFIQGQYVYINGRNMYNCSNGPIYMCNCHHLGPTIHYCS
jgi:hypothetical protein